MLLDPRVDGVPPLVRADVAIVGAGAAGITLALLLAEAGVDTVVLESGGAEPGDRAASGLTEGDWTALQPYELATSRMRALGGTTTIWTGHCRPLDRVDLRRRSWVPLSGWPIDRADLTDGYEVAQRLCEVGPEDFELDTWTPRLDAAGIQSFDGALRTAVFRLSPPTRFGERYRPELERAASVRVLLATTAVDLQVERRRIRRVIAVTPGGGLTTVEARTVVLAAGGLEVPRLLLASGVGNDHDVVGRYFLEHPHVYLGTAALTSALVDDGSWLAYGLGADLAGTRLLLTWTLDQQLIADERLLAGCFKLAQPVDDPNASRAGAVSSLAGDVTGAGPGGVFDLFLRGEQRPDRRNRVTLHPTSTDRVGLPRLQVRWQVRERDLEDHARAVAVVARELAALGLGRARVRLDADGTLPGASGGHHHMGTTRMSDDPATGVVDANLRVHGVDGLYVASSSVFPTSGYANPTLTIVALAARLARHLVEQGH